MKAPKVAAAAALHWHRFWVLAAAEVAGLGPYVAQPGAPQEGCPSIPTAPAPRPSTKVR